MPDTKPMQLANGLYRFVEMARQPLFQAVESIASPSKQQLLFVPSLAQIRAIYDLIPPSEWLHSLPESS
jgi:hypothetical protein